MLFPTAPPYSIDMALLDDLKSETDKIVRGAWKRRDGIAVPETEDLGLATRLSILKLRLSTLTYTIRPDWQLPTSRLQRRSSRRI